MPRLPHHLEEPFCNWIPPHHWLTSSALNKYLFPLVDADTVVTTLILLQLSAQGAGQCWSEPQEGRRGVSGFYPFFEVPSLPSPLIYPRQVLHISDDGVILDITVLGVWPLGSETSDNFCEGYRLFWALLCQSVLLHMARDKEMSHCFLFLLPAGVPVCLGC